MKEKQNEINKRIETFLNKRWFIVNMTDSIPQDMSYYNWVLKALESTGYAWRRDKEGKHRVFKLR